MILQALADYYEILRKEHPDDVAQPGWCSRQVSALLEISCDGKLLNIIPVGEKHGKTYNVPEQVKRSSGVAANFLCDNASYLLGFDSKGKPERARQCFEAAKEKHFSLLADLESPAAKAMVRFFETWDCSDALNNTEIQRASDILLGGGNLTFMVDSKVALYDEQIIQAWDTAYVSRSEDAVTMTCLVTGKKEPIARLHPAIKGVYGAQSMGASLVGFNARSFESYGHDEEQGLNAPVSERATFAYATALNYLLSDRNHHMRLGDTTIVYWAESSDAECSQLFSDFFKQAPVTVTQTDSQISEEDPADKLHRVMTAIGKGHAIDDADVKATFYVLGIAPNAARLSVRFFYQDTFGTILKNLEQHYLRLEIVRPPYEQRYLSPYRLLKETENPNAKQPAATSVLAGALMRSILGNQRYPEGLYENTLLRIRTEQENNERHTKKITYGRAAIIKAYLMRNCDRKDLAVDLNETSESVAYALGRLLAVLEQVQSRAAWVEDRTLNTTIVSRYFNSACATPAIAFPTIMKLNQAHLDKLRKANSLSDFPDQIHKLSKKIGTFPKRLTNEEQGDFILGYWCQYQYSFNGKKNSDNTDNQEA